MVILGGADGRGPALAAAMPRWSVWTGAAPGDDRDASLAAALADCALVVVFDAAEIEGRAAVKAAIDRWRADPSGVRVVPIGDVARAALTGLNLLQGVPWTTAAEVAAKLETALRRVAADDPTRARVRVVAHPTEVPERRAILDAVGKRRRVATPVGVGWVDDPEALADAQEADLVVLVLGFAVSEAAVPTLQRIAALPKCRRVHRHVALTAATFASCANPGAVFALRGEDAGTTGPDLVKAVTEQLDAWIDERFRGDGTAALHPWERAYLDAKRQEWTNGNHTGLMAIAGGSAMTRAQLYVPARAEPGPWRRGKDGRVRLERADAEKKDRAKPGVRREPGDPSEGEASIWLDELVTHARLPMLVVEGEAGSGKTVLLQHLAAAVASRCLGIAADEDDSRLDEHALAAGAPRLRVPILIEARRIAARLAEEESPRAIARLVADELGGCGPARLEEVEAGFVEGRYLLLVDARDEAPAERLPTLDAALVRLATQHPATRVVVPTRPAAHTARGLGAPYQTIRIAALDAKDRARMVNRWCAAMPTKHADRARDLPATLAELADRIGEGGPGESSPLGNPLFVTCAMLVYELDGSLPDGRADLYDKLVEVLCRPRGPGEAPGAEQERREIAQAVALAAQRAGEVGILQRDANDTLVRVRGYANVRVAEQRIDAMAAHTMLWRYEGSGSARRIRPWHRSFQEHLAATAEAAIGTPRDVVRRLEEELHAPAWSGTVRFLPGAFVAIHSGRGVEWIEALAAEARAEADIRRRGHVWALVADAVAEERARCFAGRGAEGSKAARLAAEVKGAWDREGGQYGWEDRLMLLDGLGRMATGEELGRDGAELVDPRLADPRRSAERWVEVRGGPHTLGAGKEAFQAGPVRVEEIPGFWLLDTPVTVQDYRPFVAAGHSAPPDWRRQVRHPNRPVVGVDEADAEAFCAWATRSWARPGGAGRIALPTAAMWEAAARGPNGDPWPWGAEDLAPGKEDSARAAHDWGGAPFRSAVPVGAFPAGHRGRLRDLAGNVWEWTSSVYTEDGSGDVAAVDNPVNSRVDAAPRVARGGSWIDWAGSLRAAGRNWGLPGGRFGSLGFRVCLLREPGL